MRSTRVESRAAALLREDSEFTVPLARLHGKLTAELGRAAGTISDLRERLRRRPDLFVLLDAPEHAWMVEAWSREAREEYRTALERLGVDTGPRVALASGPGAADSSAPDSSAPTIGVEAALQRLESSLLDLWSADPGDAAIQRELIAATAQARELRGALASLGQLERSDVPLAFHSERSEAE